MCALSRAAYRAKPGNQAPVFHSDSDTRTPVQARIGTTLPALGSLVAKVAAHEFVEPSHFTDPGVAARKLVEIANATEAAQDGRIYIELINGRFLKEGGTPDQFRAGLAQAIRSRLALAT